MTGVSHTEPEGLEFALKVMKRLRSATDTWKENTGIGFGLYGTPAESLCYRFANIDKKLFGDVKDITDKGYYTNSQCDGQGLLYQFLSCGCQGKNRCIYQI